jgi:predicted RND superfamily exporter protein
MFPHGLSRTSRGAHVTALEGALGPWVLRHRLWILLLGLLLVAAAASGGRHLGFTTNYRVFFSEDNPQLLAFEALENTYSKSDNVMFVLAPTSDDAFDEETLAATVYLTEQAWQIPYSTRVDSVSNFQHTEAQGDDLVVRDLVDGGQVAEASLRAQSRRIALEEPMLAARLASKDGRVGAVNVTVQLPGLDETAETPEVVAFVRHLAEQVREKFPGVSVYLTGMVLMNNAFSESSMGDMQTLVPLSFAIMALMLWLMTRGLVGSLATMVVVVLSILLAMGLGGWVGFPISPPSATAPTVILTVAIANCVHVFVTYRQRLAVGDGRERALCESLRVNLQPVFLASLTTALGFLSMNFSDVPPFRHLGTLVAFGVAASFVLAVTFLPALLSYFPVRSSLRAPGARLPGDATRGATGDTLTGDGCDTLTGDGCDTLTGDGCDTLTGDGCDTLTGDAGMAVLADWVIRHRRRLLWSMLAVVAVLIVSASRNELNDVFLHYFDETVEFRRHSDFTAENLTGLYQVEYSLVSSQPGGVSEPSFLRDVDALAGWFRVQPEVVHVATISDVFKRLNRNMHGDDPRRYSLPESRELAAQYLLLYEMSLPYGLDLNNQLNVDKSSTRMTVTTRTLSSHGSRPTQPASRSMTAPEPP